MKPSKTVWVTINELDAILAKHFKADAAFISSAEVGSIKNQHSPKQVTLGGGAVLTIQVEVTYGSKA